LVYYGLVYFSHFGKLYQRKVWQPCCCSFAICGKKSTACLRT
jgi:hypothetical protein